MRKIICSVLSLALSGIMLTSCNVPGFSDSSEDDADKSEYYNNSNSTQTDEQNYSWLIEPAISADNIITFDGSQVNPDNEQNKSYANYSVIRTNGKYGLIDYGGNIIIEPDYDNYYTCSCGEVVLYNVLNERADSYEYCMVDSSHQVVNYASVHDDNSPDYYWSGDKVYVINKGDDAGIEYTGKKSVVVGEAAVSQNDDGSYNIVPKEDSLYGIAKTDKLIVDMKYTDYYAPSYKGAGITGFALKDTNNKWGYVGSDGKTIIDFKCGDEPSSYNGEVLDDINSIHPYLFSDDFVPVTVGGLWGYYNIDGDCVVKAGEFEQARPVHNGKAWVRQNGLWGVIQLGEVVEEVVTTTTKATTSKAAVQTTWAAEQTTTTATTTSAAQTTTSNAQAVTTTTTGSSAVATTEQQTQATTEATAAPVVTDTQQTQATTAATQAVTDPQPAE